MLRRERDSALQPTEVKMKASRILVRTCLIVGISGLGSLIAQFPGVPKLPGFGRHKNDSQRRHRGQQEDEGAQAHAAGVPVPADSPVFDAFRKLQQQSVYHQRMTMVAADPRMQEVMAQMGFAPTETITAGDTKQVSMHFKMPVMGQEEDFELKAISRNGRLAKKWSSPASGRILAAQDASISKQLAEAEAQSAKSIARDLVSGPTGWVSAGVSAAGAAASIAEAAHIKKQAHDFFEWSCINGGAQPSPQSANEAPPLTDLRVIGDQTLDGVAVTAYEFFVRQDGKYYGPMQLFVAKDSGLPARIAMNDPQARGGMQMDYFGFNQGGDIEIPACLGEHK